MCCFIVIYYLGFLYRLVIALQVMAVGVSTPGGYAVKHWRSISMMLGPVTLAMYIISSVCVKLCLNNILSWYEAMIIGACITPTDPVLANSVIKGKFANRYIPTHLRNLLAMESGANDGLGLPFLMLPILLMTHASRPHALIQWSIHTWFYEIVCAVVLGGLCGIGARFLLRQSEKRNLIDKDSFLVFTIALTLLVTGIAALVATDDLLAVFICGNTFAWDAKFLLATHDSDISEVIDMLFNITYFVIFGSAIPWDKFSSFGIGRLCLMSLLILVFRRLPVVMMLRPWMPVLQSRKQAFFAGWFGPMGVGAIFFSLMAREYFKNPHHPFEVAVATKIPDIAFPLVSWVVLSSILIHGITVPFTNFHMKKRAKLKNKRTQKLREQLMVIAGETIKEKDLEKETSNLPQSLKMAQAAVDQEPCIEDADDGEEWEYYTDYEDVDEDEIHNLEDGTYIRTPIPEHITVIIDGVESVQETIRPGVKRKVKKRRAIQSPTQSTATSFSEILESDTQDTVLSTDIPFHLRSPPSKNP